MLAAAAVIASLGLAGLTPSPPSQANEVPVAVQAPAVRAQLTVPGAPLATLAVPVGDDRPKVIDPKTYNKYKGPNLSQRVVLTYDDCPNDLKSLDAVLVYARDHNIGLVLAPTGECHDKFLGKYKIKIAERIRAHGQYAINHSRTHPNLTKRTPANIRWQLSGEVKADYGRPPYGATNKKVADAYAAVGMRQWLWNIDTNDWRDGGKTEKQIVDYVATHATAGTTVLMHMNHKGFTPGAIQKMELRLRTGPRKLSLCRPFRGWANPPGGPVRTAPATWGNNALAC